MRKNKLYLLLLIMLMNSCSIFKNHIPPVSPNVLENTAVYDGIIIPNNWLDDGWFMPFRPELISAPENCILISKPNSNLNNRIARSQSRLYKSQYPYLSTKFVQPEGCTLITQIKTESHKKRYQLECTTAGADKAITELEALKIQKENNF